MSEAQVNSRFSLFDGGFSAREIVPEHRDILVTVASAIIVEAGAVPGEEEVHLIRSEESVEVHLHVAARGVYAQVPEVRHHEGKGPQA